MVRAHGDRPGVPVCRGHRHIPWRHSHASNSKHSTISTVASKRANSRVIEFCAALSFILGCDVRGTSQEQFGGIAFNSGRAREGSWKYLEPRLPIGPAPKSSKLPPAVLNPKNVSQFQQVWPQMHYPGGCLNQGYRTLASKTRYHSNWQSSKLFQLSAELLQRNLADC